MSGFFEPPPAPPEPEPEPRYRTPAWRGPPEGTLPGVVAVERVIARNERVAVCVARLAAYPAGFECDAVTMAADDREELDPMMFHHRHRLGRGGADLPPDMLRFGVRFADGSRATNVGGFPRPGQAPEHPIMVERDGGGGGGHWRQTYWIWPLPPPGPLAFVCEWPGVGIPLTSIELEAQAVLDAAARAQVVFSDEHLPQPPEARDGPPPVPRIR